MIRRALVFAMADKVTGLVVTLATMAVISRILTPAQIGLFLVASSLVILIEGFRDFGVAACIIQERDLARPMVRTAFTIMALLSMGLGLSVWLLSDVAAGYYGDPELGRMIRIAAFAFIAAPISNPLLALLRREMAFGRIAVVSITAAVLNAVAAISLALLGFGAFSLVWASLLSAALTAAGALIANPAFWVFRPSLSAWRRVVPFGAWSSVITLLSMLFDSLPRLVLGRILGFDAVGLFARAVSLSQMPERLMLSAVQPVVLPALAARVRENASLKEPYLLGIAHITALQWPALVVLALMAEPIVALLLGSQWTESVPLVRIVALSMLTLFPVYLAFPLLVATGRIRDMARATAIALPPSLIIILIAAQFGLQAVAFSLFLTGALQSGVLLFHSRRSAGFEWRELARTLLRSAAITLCAAPVPALVLLGSYGDPGLGGLALALPGAAAGWLVGLRLAHHPIAAELRRAVRRIPALRRRTLPFSIAPAAPVVDDARGI